MEEAQLLNDADSLLYTAEKTKTDLAGKISEADVGKIDAATRDLRKAIESKDAAEIKSKSDALRKVLQDVGYRGLPAGRRAGARPPKAAQCRGARPPAGASQGPRRRQRSPTPTTR